jgi:hypothetical protein
MRFPASLKKTSVWLFFSVLGLSELTHPALASCLNPNADSRLRTYCVSETLKGMRVGLGDAQF